VAVPDFFTPSSHRFSLSVYVGNKGTRLTEIGWQSPIFARTRFRHGLAGRPKAVLLANSCTTRERSTQRAPLAGAASTAGTPCGVCADRLDVLLCEGRQTGNKHGLLRFYQEVRWPAPLPRGPQSVRGSKFCWIVVFKNCRAGLVLARISHHLTRTSRNRKEERWPLSDDRMEAETACLRARL
jgi:hypothetical protein